MPTTEQKITALHTATTTNPEYATITPLFIALYGFVAGREGQTGISFVPSVSHNGVPLISPTDLSIERDTLIIFLMGIISVLEQQGSAGDEALDRIAQAFSAGRLEPQPLLQAIMERSRGPLESVAIELDVPAALLEYLFEIPLKTALERYAAGCSAEDFAGWQGNLCPVCGARPAMAELSGDEGRRRLSCSACFHTWEFKRICCPSCGCEDTEQLSYFTAGDGPVRVDTCRSCSRYIKTRDTRISGADIPLEVEDLLTIHLDLLAAREGFERGK